MQVKLRLQRFGTKKRPYYRIVAASKFRKRDGHFLEILGIYHPIATKTEQYKVDAEKVNAWLEKGAIPSDTVKDILRKTGIWKEFAIKKEKLKVERVKKQAQKRKEKKQSVA